jgi:hypothetical protein
MAVRKVFNDDGGTLPDSSGGGSEITENLSSQIDGVKTTFVTNHKYISGRLRVYYNGIREIVGVTVTETVARNSFSLNFTPLAGDYLIADYEQDNS